MKLNPYERLKRVGKEFAEAVKYRHTATMFTLSKKEVEQNNYSLLEIYQRTAAAQQVGYEVHLVVRNDDTLVIQYVKAPPPTPVVFW